MILRPKRPICRRFVLCVGAEARSTRHEARGVMRARAQQGVERHYDEHICVPGTAEGTPCFKALEVPATGTSQIDWAPRWNHSRHLTLAEAPLSFVAPPGFAKALVVSVRPAEAHRRVPGTQVSFCYGTPRPIWFGIQDLSHWHSSHKGTQNARLSALRSDHSCSCYREASQSGTWSS